MKTTHILKLATLTRRERKLSQQSRELRQQISALNGGKMFFTSTQLCSNGELTITISVGDYLTTFPLNKATLTTFEDEGGNQYGRLNYPSVKVADTKDGAVFVNAWTERFELPKTIETQSKETTLASS